MANLFRLDVNGKTLSAVTAPATPLLYVLRNDGRLNSPKFGCGLGQCGACTVLVDGHAIRSCITPVQSVAKSKILTLEGLGTAESLHALQRAFISEQAAQCGYCISGMIMAGKALLDKNPSPTVADIKRALAGNLCRCGTHTRIIRAIQTAAATPDR
jgi:nicotinate dehydrogenase subunit A